MVLSPTGMVLLSVVAVLLLILLVLQKTPAKPKPNKKRHPYVRRNEFISSDQSRFMQALQRSVGDSVDICPRVSGINVVKTMSQLPEQEWALWQERLLHFSFDFILLDRSDYSVVCAVDLQREETPEVIENDFVRDLCHAARVPFVRFQATDENYNISAIRSVILAHLPASTDTTKIDSTATTQEIGLICPKCSSLLVRKVARNGKHAGKEFWACSSAPRCRHAEPMPA